mgnify:CR=1 FL=1
MRDDPGQATATLVVELDDATESVGLRETVADAGGEVIEELEFDCWLVRLPEAGVDELCSLPGVVRIETDATLERTVDETVEETGSEPSGSEDTREV